MEKIEQLPKDKIPLSNEEKDIFQWLYPISNDIEKEEKKDDKKELNQSIVFYSYLIVFSIVLFVVIYPKCNFFWKKIIPTSEENPIFSIVKIFIVLFLLFVFNFISKKFL